MRALFTASLFLSSAFAATVLPRASNTTQCDSSLCTWWHNTGEINTSGRVSNGGVRQSRKYLVQVSKANGNTFSNSFVYESIPRNGNGRLYSPWDKLGSDTLDLSVDDGISIEPGNNINMAWSQFEYGRDVDVKILARDGSALGSPADVVIRPTSIRYTITSSSDGGIVIRVPKDSNGRKFSVEFKNDLYTYRSDGRNYVDNGGDVVGVEPRNALMIFASPFLPSNMVPSTASGNTKIIEPGPINQGDWGSSQVLYFPPGVYWMNSNRNGDMPKYGENHIKLDQNTYWVHFAPGAYVKGAIEYTTQRDFYATGHGVLSGEHYVYMANPATYYQAVKSDYTSLRMWSHYNLSSNGQTWNCVGPTINAPPFNTMDFYHQPERDIPSVTTRISDYKQVGAFYFQTDGPQMYPNSVVSDVFYHANDDAIKAYYSGVSIKRLTVWKVHNDPIIQMGWKARQSLRYRRSETVVPSAIIGASPFYDEGQTIDPSKSISMSVSNVVCEGLCPALLRITPLQNYRDFKISNVAFPDGLQTNSIGTGRSIIPASDGLKLGLTISNWSVGGEKVTMSNYQNSSLGQLDIDASYWGQWKIV
ncbi:Nn.00g032150.m01.CDS01 [Neocucurbitaria sp. VM-36]